MNFENESHDDADRGQPDTRPLPRVDDRPEIENDDSQTKGTTGKSSQTTDIPDYGDKVPGDPRHTDVDARSRGGRSVESGTNETGTLGDGPVQSSSSPSV